MNESIAKKYITHIVWYFPAHRHWPGHAITFTFVLATLTFTPHQASKLRSSFQVFKPSFGHRFPLLLHNAVVQGIIGISLLMLTHGHRSVGAF